MAEQFLEEIVEYCDVLTAELEAYQKDASRNMVLNPADLDLAVELRYSMKLTFSEARRITNITTAFHRTIL